MPLPTRLAALALVLAPLPALGWSADDQARLEAEVLAFLDGDASAGPRIEALTAQAVAAGVPPDPGLFDHALLPMAGPVELTGARSFTATCTFAETWDTPLIPSIEGTDTYILETDPATGDIAFEIVTVDTLGEVSIAALLRGETATVTGFGYDDDFGQVSYECADGACTDAATGQPAPEAAADLELLTGMIGAVVDTNPQWDGETRVLAPGEDWLPPEDLEAALGTIGAAMGQAMGGGARFEVHHLASAVVGQLDDKNPDYVVDSFLAASVVMAGAEAVDMQVMMREVFDGETFVLLESDGIIRMTMLSEFAFLPFETAEMRQLQNCEVTAR